MIAKKVHCQEVKGVALLAAKKLAWMKEAPVAWSKDLRLLCH